jgi:polyphosphate kinase 2 (PPK2 family)
VPEVETKGAYNKKGKLKRKVYEEELARLQEALVKLQYWIRDQGLKVAVVFEGRDAAGKRGHDREEDRYATECKRTAWV